MIIISGLREYFKTCPLTVNSRINVDFLPADIQNGIEYSIDSIPAETIIKRYIDGGAECQFVFAFTSIIAYSPDTLQNIENSGFFEELSSWMRQQSRKRTFPVLPEGLTCKRVEAIDTGALFDAEAGVGKYQIQCRLLYFKKGDR